MDVFGRGERAARRGHHAGSVGHARFSPHGGRSEPEDLRQDRRVAEPFSGGRFSLCLFGSDAAHDASVGSGDFRSRRTVEELIALLPAPLAKKRGPYQKRIPDGPTTRLRETLH